jgi:hypothetical protein
MSVRSMKASDKEVREYNRAAKIHNEGELVGVALDERFGKIAARIAREGKMGISVTAFNGEPYRSLNDAALVTGNPGYELGRTEIWYMNRAGWDDFSMGWKYAEKKGVEMPTKRNLKDTHGFLGRIKESNLNDIFRMMQGEMWSPEGQANQLIRRSGLVHTSMSVGDIVIKNGQLHMVEMSGFARLGRDMTARKQNLMTSQIKKLLPPLYSQENEKDPIVYAKFFYAYGAGTWLATEFDGRDTFFGAVNLGHGWELGYFSLRELESIEAQMGGRKIRGLQGIERDTSFRPMPLSRAKRA